MECIEELLQESAMAENLKSPASLGWSGVRPLQADGAVLLNDRIGAYSRQMKSAYCFGLNSGQ